MTVTEARTMVLKYTVEELTVLADLFEIPSLPGVRPLDLPLDLRSLATRCLIARGVLTMPQDGGVEVTQPHAALIGTMLAATTIVQVARHTEDMVETWSWFEADGVVVQAGEDHEGIVAVTLHEIELDDAILGSLGIDEASVEEPALDPIDVVVEVVRMDRVRGSLRTERTTYRHSSGGTWTRGE